MWRLEAKGHESDVKKRKCCLIPTFDLQIISLPATGSNIMFVRGDEQSKAVQEMQSAENPDEIDISEDEDEDEEEEGGEDGKYLKSVKASLFIIPGEPPKKKEKVAVEEMDVPDKVFGGLKKPSAE